MRLKSCYCWGEWSRALKAAPPALASLAIFLDASIETTSLLPTRERAQRSGSGLEVLRRRFTRDLTPGRERFLREMENYLAPISRVETADFEIVGIEEAATSSLAFDVDIRYNLVGQRKDSAREQRVGHWITRWLRDETRGWRAARWQATEETTVRVREPIFIDVTAQALGRTASYKNQMLRGVDHWRTVLDGASGVDVYGNNGLAVEISTTMDLTIYTSASPPDCPTVSIAIAAMEPSKM